MKPLQSLASKSLSPRFNTLLGFGCHCHKASHPDVILIHSNQKTFLKTNLKRLNLNLFDHYVHESFFGRQHPIIFIDLFLKFHLTSKLERWSSQLGSRRLLSRWELHPSSNLHFSLQPSSKWTASRCWCQNCWRKEAASDPGFSRQLRRRCNPMISWEGFPYYPFPLAWKLPPSLTLQKLQIARVMHPAAEAAEKKVKWNLR